MIEFEIELMNLLEAKSNALHKGIAANLHGTAFDRSKACDAEEEYFDKLQAFLDKWMPNEISRAI